MARSSQKIDPADLAALGAPLSDEEGQAQQAARAFVREHVLPFIEDWFEAGTFPREIVSELGELGVLGMQLEGYGSRALALSATG